MDGVEDSEVLDEIDVGRDRRPWSRRTKIALASAAVLAAGGIALATSDHPGTGSSRTMTAAPPIADTGPAAESCVRLHPVGDVCGAGGPAPQTVVDAVRTALPGATVVRTMPDVLGPDGLLVARSLMATTSDRTLTVVLGTIVTPQADARFAYHFETIHHGYDIVVGVGPPGARVSRTQATQVADLADDPRLLAVT